MRQVLSKTEVIEEMKNIIHAIEANDDVDSLMTDNEGQVIIYTNVYRRGDGSYDIET